MADSNRNDSGWPTYFASIRRNAAFCAVGPPKVVSIPAAPSCRTSRPPLTAPSTSTSPVKATPNGVGSSGRAAKTVAFNVVICGPTKVTGGFCSTAWATTLAGSRAARTTAQANPLFPLPIRADFAMNESSLDWPNAFLSTINH